MAALPLSAQFAQLFSHAASAMRRLGALAYYFEGQPGTAGQDVITSLIPGATLLTANHIPCAGEYEIRNAHATGCKPGRSLWD